MPALQMAGMAMPAYATYIARLQSLAASASAYKMNFGMAANSSLQQQLLANANWSYGLAGRYGMQSSGWPFGNNNTNQFPGVPKDWRNGDWLCSCGFHNYSSRTQCKECGAPVPSGIPSTTMKTTSDASSSKIIIFSVPTVFFTLTHAKFQLLCWSNAYLPSGTVHSVFFFCLPRML
jgi:hypothetical protein